MIDLTMSPGPERRWETDNRGTGKWCIWNGSCLFEACVSDCGHTAHEEHDGRPRLVNARVRISQWGDLRWWISKFVFLARSECGRTCDQSLWVPRSSAACWWC